MQVEELKLFWTACSKFGVVGVSCVGAAVTEYSGHSANTLTEAIIKAEKTTKQKNIGRQRVLPLWRYAALSKSL